MPLGLKSERIPHFPDGLPVPPHHHSRHFPDGFARRTGDAAAEGGEVEGGAGDEGGRGPCEMVLPQGRPAPFT